MSTYNDLQDIHQQLLERRDAGEEPLALQQAVTEYIKRVRSEASQVSRPRDRDQLRANLRFWATFMYDETGIYPDTTLVPASETSPQDDRETSSHSDVINLPGPIDLPRWVAIVGIAIITLLILLLVVITPQLKLAQDVQATQQVIQFTQEVRENIQGTGIVIVQTAVSNPASGEPSTPTPDASSDSSDVTATMGLLLTEVAATTTAQYTPPPTLTPTLPVSETIYLRPMLIAKLENITNPDSCSKANIQVIFDLDTKDLSSDIDRETIQSISVEDFQVIINPLDSLAYTPPSVQVRVDVEGIANVGANAITANTSYLVQVSNPDVTTSDVIVRFDDTCSQNKTLTYQWKDFPSPLPTQPASNDELSLSWQLMTWGPAPQVSPSEDAPWIANFKLSASGGDGQYIYWIYRNQQFEALEGDQLSIQSKGACQPASAAISVTSGGLSVVREIVLFPPFCTSEAVTRGND